MTDIPATEMLRKAGPFGARMEFMCGLCTSARPAGSPSRNSFRGSDSDDPCCRNRQLRGLQAIMGAHEPWRGTLGSFLLSRSRLLLTLDGLIATGRLLGCLARAAKGSSSPCIWAAPKPWL